MVKIIKTYIRSEETLKKYIEKNNERKNDDGKSSERFMDRLDRIAIKKFKYWIIVPDRFPYDKIAETSHVLFIRREVKFDWDLLNEDERKELRDLKKGYIADNYDVVWENLPKGRSIPHRLHLHLLKIKKDEIIE